ncbi:MAG: hypothetical protein IH628_13325 [Proteobacteria bacterium]|nr:hypothetical protein [Pseudomonadota bacterium]
MYFVEDGSVRGTNLSPRRSIIVRVNDSGPFVDSRIIDVSVEAANKQCPAVKFGIVKSK